MIVFSKNSRSKNAKHFAVRRFTENL